MTDTAGSATSVSMPSPRRGSTLFRIALLLSLVYLFILSITLLGEAFKLFGEEFAETIFQATSNPIIGLMIGILATAIIQSSSTTTTIVVGLVATGVLSFESSVAMVMGANIGTSVTNTIVSMSHIARGEEFKRAFASAILHDFFNVCSVVVLLPLQIYFNLIGRSARLLETVFAGFGGLRFSSPLQAITRPVAEEIKHLTGDSGWLSALIAFLLLFVALRYIVKVLRSMVFARVERFFQRYVFRAPILGFALGIGLTTLVQSSSITTSLIVPLIGAGVITLSQVYPYLLGANIGTTITAFLASFVIGSHVAVAVAFAHLVFNVFGICIFWPLKRIPIWMAVRLSEWSQRSRLIPILYILVAFFIIPGAIIFFCN